MYIVGSKAPSDSQRGNRWVADDDPRICIALDFADRLRQRFAVKYDRPFPPCQLALQLLGADGYDQEIGVGGRQLLPGVDAADHRCGRGTDSGGGLHQRSW